MDSVIDLTGQRFGRLLVLHRVKNVKPARACWHCRCDCGNEINTLSWSLRSGETRSCGCLLREIAVREGKFKQARQLIGQAFQQSTLSPHFDPDSVAAMYSIQCTLEAQDKHWGEALKRVQQEISLLETRQNAESPLLANAYALRGELYDQLGEYRLAVMDLQNALSRFQKSPGLATPVYLSAELIYARILRHSGSSIGAARLEGEANVALAQIHRQHCSGCSLSVLSFH